MTLLQIYTTVMLLRFIWEWNFSYYIKGHTLSSRLMASSIIAVAWPFFTVTGLLQILRKEKMI